MIQIYTAKISDSQKFFNDLCFENANEAEKERSPQSKAALFLLHEGLKVDFRSFSGLKIAVGDTGKPYFVTSGGEPAKLWFNLSHSGDYTICAISDSHEVGVDIQKILPAKMNVAKRIFSTEQYTSLLEKEGAARDSLFCAYWVLYESALKLHGGRVLEKADISCASLVDDAPRGYRVALAVRENKGE